MTVSTRSHAYKHIRSMADMATVDIAPGVQLPLVGLGTYKAQGSAAVAAVTAALAAGFRHIDTAAVYNNYAEVRQGIAASGISRQELFITSKVSPFEHGTEGAAASVQNALHGLGALLCSPGAFPRCWCVAQLGLKTLLAVD